MHPRARARAHTHTHTQTHSPRSLPNAPKEHPCTRLAFRAKGHKFTKRDFVADWLKHWSANPVDKRSTPGRDWPQHHFFFFFRFVLPSHHLCRFISACLGFGCTARTKIVALVKDPTSTFRREKAYRPAGDRETHRQRLIAAE